MASTPAASSVAQKRAFRQSLLCAAAVASLAIAFAPSGAQAFTCGQSGANPVSTPGPAGDGGGATDNGAGGNTACGPGANANGGQATATGIDSKATGASASA